MLEHFWVRRRTSPPRSVIWGWDARRGLVMALIVVGVVATAWPGLLFYWKVAVGVVALGAAAGFRVAIDERGVTTTKLLLGVPYRWRQIPLGDVQVLLYDTFEDPKPAGVVVCTATSPGEWEWIIGTSGSAEELARVLRSEIEHVRDARTPTSYRE